MCGIAGFFDPDLSESEARLRIQSMLEQIAHRGPDARGVFLKNGFVLGHNRLSIIDLSEDGNQPMVYENLVITYNGEIYNYKEIRKRLEKEGMTFRTQSDTEVILAAYSKYGPDCCNWFVGMWAFVIYDTNTNSIFCSRDRFGIKPFYYHFDGKSFYFASEYKPFFAAGKLKKDLNLNQVSRGLQLGWVSYHDETWFSQLKQLPAAHHLWFNDGEVSIKEYWNLENIKPFNGSFEGAADQFREKFLDSLHLHMRSDVEIGGCLSGGLDSSSIASGVNHLFPELDFKTFTIYFEGKDEVDERPWVREVTQKYPHLKENFYSPSSEEIQHGFEEHIRFADVPVTGSSPTSQYFVMKLAQSKGIKVLLDGQGSDEFLAGYTHSFYRLIGGYLKGFKFGKAFQELGALKNGQHHSLKKSADVFFKSLLSAGASEQQLYGFEYKHFLPFVSPAKESPFSFTPFEGSDLDKFLKTLSRYSLLPSLLHFEDRNSMAFSIESRVPFLDHRLVEFGFSLPDHFKINHGITKLVLRKGLKDLLPEKIANRTDKKGFVTPGEVKWLRGPLRHLVDAPLKNLDFLDLKKSENLISDFKKGNNQNATLVWRLVVLNYWLKTI